MLLSLPYGICSEAPEDGSLGKSRGSACLVTSHQTSNQTSSQISQQPLGNHAWTELQPILPAFPNSLHNRVCSEAPEDVGLGKSRGSACLATEAAPHTRPLKAAVTSKVLQEPR